MSEEPPWGVGATRWGRRWKVAVWLALVVVAGAAIVVEVRGARPSGPAAVCDQLSMPGLTKPEAQQMLKNAADRGISTEELRQRCGDLVDEFSAP